jgi:hypothetical protein
MESAELLPIAEAGNSEFASPAIATLRQLPSK